MKYIRSHWLRNVPALIVLLVFLAAQFGMALTTATPSLSLIVAAHSTDTSDGGEDVAVKIVDLRPERRISLGLNFKCRFVETIFQLNRADSVSIASCKPNDLASLPATSGCYGQLYRFALF